MVASCPTQKHIPDAPFCDFNGKGFGAILTWFLKDVTKWSRRRGWSTMEASIANLSHLQSTFASDNGYLRANHPRLCDERNILSISLLDKHTKARDRGELVARRRVTRGMRDRKRERKRERDKSHYQSKVLSSVVDFDMPILYICFLHSKVLRPREYA